MATTAGDEVLAYLTEQLAALRKHEQGARAGHDEAIHQLRVAVRRLRSVLATGADLFGDGTVTEVASGLRWLSRALGAARDPVVVGHRLGALLGTAPTRLPAGSAAEPGPGPEPGPAADFIAARLGPAAAAGLARLRQALGSDRYALLIGRLAGIDESRLTAEAALPARRKLVQLAAAEEARLARTVLALPPAGADGRSGARDRGLHDVRKAAKRLRYAAELVPVGDGQVRRTRIRRVAAAARELQDILGQHQDSVQARAALREWGLCEQRPGQGHPSGRTPERPHRDSPDSSAGDAGTEVGASAAFILGLLHEREDQLADRLEADFLQAWQRFPRPPRSQAPPGGANGSDPAES